MRMQEPGCGSACPWNKPSPRYRTDIAMHKFGRVCVITLIISTTFLLSGCAATGSAVERRTATSPEPECFAVSDVPSEDEPEAEADVASLLGCWRRLRAQPDEAQEREFRHVQDALTRAYSPLAKLRLALLLLLPETSFKDEARARHLLRELPETGTPAEYLSLSGILLVILDERDAQDRAYSRLADRWQAEQNQRRALQGQLNAIKAIEKAMTERKRTPKLLLDDVE